MSMIKDMTRTIRLYKRKCDKEIGGCGHLVDITNAVTLKKGKLHLCQRCAGRIVRKGYEKGKGKYDWTARDWELWAGRVFRVNKTVELPAWFIDKEKEVS